MSKSSDVKIETFALPAAQCQLVKTTQGAVHFAGFVQTGKSLFVLVFQTAAVVAVVEQHGERFFAIPPRPSSFLEIGFEAIGQFQVHHRAHIRFIDAHTKGVGADHHPGASVYPGVLFGRAFIRRQSGVVIIGRDAFFLQKLGDLLRTTAIAHIHHAAAGHFLQDLDQLIFLGFAWPDDVGQIGPGKTGLKYVLVFKFQFLLYVLHHFGGCGSRKRHHRDFGEIFPDFGNFQVRWPKIVPPLRNTVRLVYGNEVDLHLFDAGAGQVAHQAFGRKVQELDFAVYTIVQQAVDVAVGHARVDSEGWDAFFLQVLHLVFHQGNQGRNDDADAGLAQGRHLKTNRFAASGRQQRQGVPTIQHRLDDGFLLGPKLGVPPVLLQHINWLHSLNVFLFSPQIRTDSHRFLCLAV